jgi:hypothetical protein
MLASPAFLMLLLASARLLLLMSRELPAIMSLLKAAYEGKDFWLVDTAGLKSAEDEFELSIQEQITEAADSS